jgi:RNA polymerase sigma-70 factor (ECF subfamily)
LDRVVIEHIERPTRTDAMEDVERLFIAHRDPVYRYLCRAVGFDAAGDLTQEVFLRAARSALPTIGNPRAWIFRVARNVALDHQRQRRRRPEAALPGVESGRPPHQDVATAINEALQALPDVDRDVFLMRELGGLSYDEIATACELTPDAVRSRIHRARLQLRGSLAAPIASWRTVSARPATQDV